MESRTFVLDRPERLSAFSAFLSKQSLPLDVTVKPYVPKRSEAQNKRLWALHGLAADVTGYNKDDLHELMLCKHFGYQDIAFAGQTKQVPLKRSSARDKKEFREFLDFVEEFYACELGVWLGKDDDQTS